jgi:hypothetical protein
MRVLSQTELMRLSRTELMVLQRRIAGDLATFRQIQSSFVTRMRTCRTSALLSRGRISGQAKQARSGRRHAMPSAEGMRLGRIDVR